MARGQNSNRRADRALDFRGAKKLFELRVAAGIQIFELDGCSACGVTLSGVWLNGNATARASQRICQFIVSSSLRVHSAHPVRLGSLDSGHWY